MDFRLAKPRATRHTGLVFLLFAHLAGLASMGIVRGAFYLTLRDGLAEETTALWPAFVRGLWFDNVVACYISIVPLVVWGICWIGDYWRRWLGRAIVGWFVIVYALVLMACVANIPYFAYFSRTLNNSIWQWFAYPEQTAGMVAGEASWLKWIALYFVLIILYVFVLIRLLRFVDKRPAAVAKKGLQHYIFRTIVTVCLIALCLFGIRGRMGYNPIKISAAYYCENPILNQLGLNPAFCLLQTTIDSFRPENKTLHLCDPEEAVRDVQTWLGRHETADCPITAYVPQGDTLRRKNVVIILMESMSANLLTRHGGHGLTPFLDSLATTSLYFANCYSAGNHTNHGIVATLYGQPAILKRNAMKGSDIPRMSGLPTVLRQANWQTMFFMTHEAQYDNMNAFLRTNGYDKIFAEENYPRERRANHFGVPDDFLFSYALPRLTEASRSGKPFFATLLTISNHPPYVIPSWFRAHSKKPEEQIVEYADHCLRMFFEKAKKQSWYTNTIFVLLGDHGKQLGTSRYEVNESFNHIPLFFFGEGIIPNVRTDYCGQLDVAPTLLSYLGLAYNNKSFGINLLSHRRPAIFYSADAVVCARDSAALYIYNPEAEREFLYDVSTPAFRPIPAHTDRTRFLKRYVFSNLQAAEAVRKGAQ